MPHCTAFQKLIPCISYDLKRPLPTSRRGATGTLEVTSRDGNAAHRLSGTRRFVLARGRRDHGGRRRRSRATHSPTSSASVADATLDQGLAPLENAIEGTVSATIDGLVFDHDLVIIQEIVIPIRLHLLARPGVALTDVTNVRSYVHALAQCRAYLHDLDVTIEQTSSTSQAAREVAASAEPWAAVASALAG